MFNRKLSFLKKVSATVAQSVERVLGMAPFLFKKEKAPGFKRNTNPLVLRVTHFFLGLALDLFLLGRIANSTKHERVHGLRKRAGKDEVVSSILTGGFEIFSISKHHMNEIHDGGFFVFLY